MLDEEGGEWKIAVEKFAEKIERRVVTKFYE